MEKGEAHLYMGLSVDVGRYVYGRSTHSRLYFEDIAVTAHINKQRRAPAIFGWLTLENSSDLTDPVWTGQWCWEYLSLVHRKRLGLEYEAGHYTFENGLCLNGVEVAYQVWHLQCSWPSTCLALLQYQRSNSLETALSRLESSHQTSHPYRGIIALIRQAACRVSRQLRGQMRSGTDFRGRGVLTLDGYVTK